MSVTIITIRMCQVDSTPGHVMSQRARGAYTAFARESEDKAQRVHSITLKYQTFTLASDRDLASYTGIHAILGSNPIHFTIQIRISRLRIQRNAGVRKAYLTCYYYTTLGL